MAVCSINTCCIDRAVQSVFNCTLANGYFSRCFTGQFSVFHQPYGYPGAPAHPCSEEAALASDCAHIDFDPSHFNQLELTASAANLCLLSTKKGDCPHREQSPYSPLSI